MMYENTIYYLLTSHRPVYMYAHLNYSYYYYTNKQTIKLKTKGVTWNVSLVGCDEQTITILLWDMRHVPLHCITESEWKGVLLIVLSLLRIAFQLFVTKSHLSDIAATCVLGIDRKMFHSLNIKVFMNNCMLSSASQNDMLLLQKW